ncbi:RDD family protein [Paucibacter sp. B51]|uniref:RDD family protein n=1 Tax=Paucibacter sp. B51 TaxID=2993315 RepID=UPI0022EC0D0E|nr:RDD family protein [Paucibacter sp. B51]
MFRLFRFASRAAADHAADPRATVKPEDVNVAPALLGQPLATPRQRALAMGIDVAVLALVSQLANNWLMMAAALGLYTWLRQVRPEVFARLRWRRGRANLAAGATESADADLVLAPPPPQAPRRRWLSWLLVAWFSYQGVTLLFHGDPEAEADAAAEAASELGTPLSKAELRALREQAEEEPEAATDAAESVASAASAAELAQALQLAQAQHHQALHRLLREQEAQLEHLREEVVLAGQPQAMRWLKAGKRWLDELLRHYVTPALYFCLLPLLWPGQTLGKRLLGLRVQELSGKPMTLMLGFRRFGGYAAATVTGGIGLLQILWDPNRQGLQDKTAHTVVIDVRGQQPPAPALQATPQENSSLD